MCHILGVRRFLFWQSFMVRLFGFITTVVSGCLVGGLRGPQWPVWVALRCVASPGLLARHSIYNCGLLF